MKMLSLQSIDGFSNIQKEGGLEIDDISQDIIKNFISSIGVREITKDKGSKKEVKASMKNTQRLSFTEFLFN